jgi:hypothetical protein
VVALQDLSQKPDLVLDTAAVRRGAGTLPHRATTALGRSALVARFGSGHGRADLRQVLPVGSDPAEERDARAQIGGALVTNTRLRLTPGAWATLAGGAADPRLLTALDSLAAHHDVDVDSLPRPEPERRAGAPARRAIVTAIDGAAVRRGTPTVRAASRILRAQRPPYRPHIAFGKLRGRTVLLVGYSAPTPFGLTAPTPSGTQ